MIRENKESLELPQNIQVIDGDEITIDKKNVEQVQSHQNDPVELKKTDDNASDLEI